MEIKVTIPDEKKNGITLKRMDLLEKKLDQQYKNRIEGRDITKEFSVLQTSFMNKLGRFMDSNREQIAKQNNKLTEALKKITNTKTTVIKTERAPNAEIKSFISKISSLEEAIRSITLKAKKNTPHNNNDGRLNKSFEV